MQFNDILLNQFDVNPFKAFDKWFLLSAGKKDDFNSMTISWGEMGIMWGKPIVTVGVRHSRHTFKFMENNDHFAISYFDENYKKSLSLYGCKSGRDIDKMSSEHFTPCFINDTVVFEEAQYAIICKKIYEHEITRENFVGLNHKDFYSTDNNDLHKIYYGEVVRILKK